MIEALALDLLLIFILLLLVPIGLYRGGVREVCSAAGVLLGLLVATAWSSRWGEWLADLTGIDTSVSQFVVAVGTIVTFAALIGYGAAASFAYSPGPGGRLYGGLIALMSGVIFLGAVIQFVATYLYDGVYPDLIRDGYVSRALSTGFDRVLLAVSLAALLATLFGMIVRERETDEVMIEVSRPEPVTRRSAPKPVQAPEPVSIEPASGEAAAEPMSNTATVKIREVRHWEEPVPPTLQDLKSGWSRTWPSDVSREAPKPSWSPRVPPQPQSRPNQGKPSNPDEAVIRDWLAEDRPRGTPSRRPPRDE